MLPSLPLDNMDVRHWGLTPAVAANNKEAATVCLNRHHNPPTTFAIENNTLADQTQVEWVQPDARVLDAWNNRIDATEMGAYACALAGVELAKGYFAVRRAETGTGSDYYIGPPASGVEDLENCYRLEVSGVDAGTERDIRQRLLQKIDQTRRGHSNLPAVAAVVGFSARLIVLADAETV
jgi:hypothetical protein